jgi:hypothetical protein
MVAFNISNVALGSPYYILIFSTFILNLSRLLFAILKFGFLLYLYFKKSLFPSKEKYNEKLKNFMGYQ